MKNKMRKIYDFGRAVASILSLLLFLLCGVTATAQNREISGTVLDETGQPAIGATVVVKGTNSMTITGLDGQFRLSVPKDAGQLEISYVGYETAKLVLNTGKSVYNVKLKVADLALDEVVVIGYGTAKKGNVTGSIATLKGEKVADRQNENVLSSLQGQLAGVEITTNSGAPGGELEVHIRGAASINASDQPLYVVDGIPVDDLNDLNADDIESIDVLKDASSSAIYGSRGANGVILIKTKEAQKTGKVNVQFSASFGIQQMEKKLDVLTPAEWIAWRSEINNQNYVRAYGSKGAMATDDYEIRLAYTGGSVNTSYINDPRWTQPGYGDLMTIDWQDEVFRLAPKQNYTLSVSNSTDQSSYRVSLGYVDQKGIAINTSYKRLNLRANMQTTIFNRITLGVNLAPSMSWNNGGTADAVAVLSMVPFAEPEAGIYTGAEPYSRYSWAGTRVSPVATLERKSSMTEDARINTSAFIRAELFDGLRAEVTGSYNFRSTQARSFLPSSISNRWNTGEGYYATANRTDGRNHSYLFQTLLNYDNSFGKHTVGAMAGFSLEARTSYSSRLAATHFPDNLVESFDMTDVDLTTAYATIGYPGRMASFFGRLQYEYDNRYLMTASIRRDGSSKFGKNKRWGIFPAVSLAYRISNERFWPEDFVINSMKVRGSWGANGNNSLSDGAALGLMSSANYSLGGSLMNGYAMSSLDVEDLTWEKVYSWNVGADFSLFNSRLSVSLDYYQKKTSDLLYKVTMPGIIGFSDMWDNVGEVQNKGFELELQSQNLTGAVRWSTSFNMAYNKNEVTDLGNNDKIFSNSNTQVLMVGQPMRSFYMYDAVGVYQYSEDLRKYPVRKGTALGDVRYRDVNDDGVINDDDRTLVGKPNPDFTFGMTNKLSWKAFDLSVLCTAQFGGMLYSMSPGRYMDNPGMAISQNVFSWWKNMWRSEEEPGDGKTPALTSTTGELRDTRWLYSSDYIRIKNITLGYKLPLNRKIVRNARVYFTVENVWMWDKYDGGYSPENKGNNAYPQARTYTIGANFSF